MREFLAFEKIAFAHVLDIPGYRYASENAGYGIYGEAPEHGGVLEIGYVRTGTVELELGAEHYTVPEEGVFILPPNTPFTAAAPKGSPYSHTSVEFLVRTREPALGETPRIPFDFPVVLPPSALNREIISIIDRIESARVAELNMTYFEECELFMRLLRRIRERSESLASKNACSPGNRLIAKRAKAYISAHLTQTPTVGDIADALSISKNYLTNVFSRAEGMPLTEYMNRLRIAHVEDLIRKYHYSLSEAGALVGLHDANYLSRLFKQYTGRSYSDFRRER